MKFNKRLWGMPLLLTLLSLAGLLSALVGDGIWDGLSWATLGFPLLLVIRKFIL